MRPPRAGAPAPGSSTLAVQLGALDGAREALASGDAPRALRELDAFDTRHPSSPLAEEAAALRFDALVAKGDRDGAARAGRAFVARWPSSPYAARIRRAVDDHGAASPEAAGRPNP